MYSISMNVCLLYYINLIRLNHCTDMILMIAFLYKEEHLFIWFQRNCLKKQQKQPLKQWKDGLQTSILCWQRRLGAKWRNRSFNFKAVLKNDTDNEMSNTGIFLLFLLFHHEILSASDWHETEEHITCFDGLICKLLNN